MDNRVTLRPQLPQSRELDNFEARVVRQGAQPLPQVELQTRVPDLGPFTLGSSGWYELQVSPGPLLRVVAAPTAGQSLDLTA
jgi:hypothetical protein